MFTLFFGGDAMLGRGVDQILPYPGSPRLHEPVVDDARDYVDLAAARHGPVPRAVSPAWIWGDAPAELARHHARVRIVNLETAVTDGGAPAASKSIHYRLSPPNAVALNALGVDVAHVANNHVLDWGVPGLRDTLVHLDERGIAHVGAGRDLAAATARATLVREGRRVFVTGVCSRDCGVPADWRAGHGKDGVALLPSLHDDVADVLAERATRGRRRGDVVVVSIHWGSNWGDAIPPAHVRFARRLVQAGVDVVHGHSSHHVRAVERHGRGVILYGCGELIDDYEGIAPHGPWRSDLVLLYFVGFDDDGGPPTLTMTPMRLRRLRLERADPHERRALFDALKRASAPGGAALACRADGDFVLAASSG
jgi:poly-gamma-glutamate capsule biosynthesis protein CapA/YwtB (metallophosphatase superfamily)